MRSPVQHPDRRVTPLALDVTNLSQIQRAVGAVDTLDVLINNAGIALYDDLSNLDVLEQTLAVNFLGLLKVTNAFLPLLKRSKGAILNNLSLAGLAPLPVIPSYSASTAAALNLTQSFRVLLAGQGVTVHAVILGPVDTDMNRGFEHTESLDRVRGRGHLRRVGKRGRGDLPRSCVPIHRQSLARRCEQSPRTPVRSFHAAELGGVSCVRVTGAIHVRYV
jgi:NAD(P)-dependent dehydrogenase (short-subunit alcohol dehydrogenase family)